MSVEVVASYHAALGAALRRHVDDPQTLRRIYDDVAAIEGRRKA